MWEYNHNELYHYGIKGQRWGVRRYVNPDGTLTPQGMARYGYIQDKNQVKALEKQDKPFFRTQSKIVNAYKPSNEHLMKQNDKAQKRYEKLAAKAKDLADTEDEDIIKLAEKATRQKAALSVLFGPFAGAFADVGFTKALEEDYKKYQKDVSNHITSQVVKTPDGRDEVVYTLKL